MIRLLLALLLVLLSAWPTSAARHFNGTSNFAVSASALTLSGSPKLTVAFWLKMDAYNGVEAEALDYGDGASFNGTFIVIPDSAVDAVFVFLQDVSPAKLVGITFPRPSVGAWHHYVMTFDRSLTALDQIVGVWVDGTAQTLTSAGFSDDVQSAWGDLALNVMARNGTTNFTGGSMAELALYSGYNFLQADVDALYARGAGIAATSVQNSHLSYYWSICGSASPEPGTTGGINMTVSGTTQVTHAISGPCGVFDNTTVTAVSCTADEVQKAFNGIRLITTRVNIPAGSCTWSVTDHATLTLPVGIGNFTLAGAGNGAGAAKGCGACATRITQDSSAFSGFNELIDFEASNLPYPGIVRITGFKFDRTAAGNPRAAGFIKYVGANQLRVDHSTFNSEYDQWAMQFFGPLVGVWDHNTGHNGPFADTNVGSLGANDSLGDGAWALPTAFGSDQFFFVETNTFYSGAGVAAAGASNDCSHGAKVVSRYNTLESVSTHGNDEDNFRARPCRAMEVYGNTFTTTVPNFFNGVFATSGPYLVWGNSVDSNYDSFVTIHSERSSEGGLTNGAFNPAAGYAPFPSSWGNCGTAQTGTGSNIDENADAPTGYRCIDMPGIGVGDLLANEFATIVNTATGATASSPNIWPRQQVEPIYEWLTTGFTHDQAHRMNPHEPTSIIENRNYFADKGGAFNGTVGVGSGLLSARPATCTPGPATAGPPSARPGVGYWATDEQKLYVCTAANTWTFYYAPFTYPHPLIAQTDAPAFVPKHFIIRHRP